MGIGAANLNGSTLLSVDRAGALSAKHFSRIPLLNFLLASKTRNTMIMGSRYGKKDTLMKMENGRKVAQIGKPGIGAHKHWIKTHILPDLVLAAWKK